MNISGKTALVLGATRGIGLAIAKAIGEQGANLVLPWHDDWPEAAAAMCNHFENQKGDHLTLQADVRRADDVTRITRTIEKRFGCLDILINNIERGGMPIIHGAYHRPVNADQWQLEMETTLHAKWRMFESCLPLLKKSQESSVINISSIAGIIGRSGPAGLLFNDGYAAANRGIGTLTETWARLGSPNVRVNEIMLGLIDTRHGPGTRGWKELQEKDREKLISHTLLKRTGKPEEVAETVLFLLERATYMTGSILRVDGGYILGSSEVPSMPAGVI